MSYQLAKELVQIGLIQTPQQFAKLAEVPGIEHLDDITSPQLGLAERENVELFTDAELVPIPELFHDHRTHIASHNAARASARYRDLDDTLKRAFDNHVLAHEKLAMEEALRMQQLAIMSPVLAGAARRPGRSRCRSSSPRCRAASRPKAAPNRALPQPEAPQHLGPQGPQQPPPQE